MILDEYIEVTIGPVNKQYFLDKGYEIPTQKDCHGKDAVKRGTKIQVLISDLTKNSHVKIHVACDNCGSDKYITYQSYNDKIDKWGEYLCKKCQDIHQRQTINEKYGVDNISQIQEVKDKKIQKSLEKYNTTNPMKDAGVKEKVKQTNMERYGCESYFQTNEFKENHDGYIIDKYGSLDNYYETIKINTIKTNNQKYGKDWYTQTDEYKIRHDQTCLEKYGYTQPSQNEEVKQKIANTIKERYGENYFSSEEFQQKVREANLEKTGYAYPTQNPVTKEKIKKTFFDRYGGWYTATDEYQEKYKKTCLEKYGKEHVMEVPEIVEKIRKTMTENGNVPTSIQQVYLHELYGGEINYPFNFYSLDIYDKDKKIAVEYSGGGHDLGVKLNKITQDEFNHKEIIRFNYIKNAGIKLIEIQSPHDLLPSDEVLLQIYRFAEKYFNETNHNWITFYPEENKYRNAEHKEPEGSFYDYGKLRKITKSDLK